MIQEEPRRFDDVFCELVPLAVARKTLIPKSCSPATIWRWITKGLEPAEAGGERIRLAVTYVGRTPYVTRQDLDAFFKQCTAARLAKPNRILQRAADVSAEELRAAGLS